MSSSFSAIYLFSLVRLPIYAASEKKNIFLSSFSEIGRFQSLEIRSRARVWPARIESKCLLKVIRVILHSLKTSDFRWIQCEKSTRIPIVKNNTIANCTKSTIRVFYNIIYVITITHCIHTNLSTTCFVPINITPGIYLYEKSMCVCVRNDGEDWQVRIFIF